MPNFSSNLDLIEIRVEIMLNNFVEKKKLFWTTKKTFSKSPKSHFSKEVNPCSWSKNAILFSFFVFGQHETRNKVSWCSRWKNKLFLTVKSKFFKVPKIVLFQRGLIHAFSQKMHFFFHFFVFGQNKIRDKV